MNRRTLIAALIALAFSAVPAMAQDLSGTWEITSQGRRGAQTSTLVLVQDGSELTGKLSLTLGGRRGGGGGGPMEIDVEDGMVDGNSFSFSITLTFGDNSIERKYSGTFDGDSMEGEVSGGGRGGRGGGPTPFSGERG